MDAAHVFFYGTLMSGFPLRREVAVDDHLRFVGRGRIRGRLFDLGRYPGAVAVGRERVYGETYVIIGPRAEVLEVLDQAEGCGAVVPSPGARVAKGAQPGQYVRTVVPVTLDAGAELPAWVYFYNSTLTGAVHIPSGDYRAYLLESALRR